MNIYGTYIINGNEVAVYRANNDINGNPRYVFHYTAIGIPSEVSVFEKYSYALAIAKKRGGKKFHNKQFGGGIVFQSYSPETDLKYILTGES